ncbi:ribonuclease H-like domain-containing protein [Tanacetum coccineum]
MGNQPFSTHGEGDPSLGNWNTDTGASSHLNDSVHSLSDVLNMCIYPSVSVGDGYSIPVTNSGHNGTLSRFKARLIANGSTHLEGIDVDETFSSVVKSDTIWTPLEFQDSAHPDYHIIASLHQEFSMTDLGSLNYFLVISVTRDSSRIILSQRKYTIDIFEREHMVNCNPSRTPVDTESKLGDDGDPVCLYMHDLWEPHFSAHNWILRYVRGTLDHGLLLFSSSTISLVAYSDADWAGCFTTRRSTFGYCVFLDNNLLSWSSKRQPMLSRSSAKVEYHGVANAIAETCWLGNLLRELHTRLSFATLVYCDSVNAVYLSSNPVHHQRTKHIEIDIHFV